MCVSDGWVRKKGVAVICLRRADINADTIRLRQRGWLDAGVFERFPGQLKKNSLLGVDLYSFAGRYAEYGRIETPDVVQNTRRPSVAFAPFMSMRMTKTSQRKAISRHLRYSALALKEQRPELRN